MLKFWLTPLVLVIFNLQSVTGVSITDFFKDVSLHIDTLEFSYSENIIQWNKKTHLSFLYFDENESVLIQLQKKKENTVDSVSLIRSGDYQIVDKILNKEDHFEFKAALQNITTNNFIRLLFEIHTKDDSIPALREINLFPYTKTEVQFKPVGNELFIGEVKTFEVFTNQLINIRPQNTWMEEDDYDYRITKTFSQLQLHLLPKKTGDIQINIPIQTIKPYITEEKEIIYKLPYIEEFFIVKSSRLQFLNIDKKEITLNEDARTKGIEIQIDNNRLLHINKTYRIENQENPGGHLIGELFTRSYLGNDRILCWLRIYNYHRTDEGYLYIKDRDVAKFITNFNITPKTSIEEIKLLRDGANWTTNMNIYPGETFIVRIEGAGLHKARFQFENLELIKKDSLTHNENVIEYQLHVPIDISKKQLSIFNHARLTSHQFNVREYQRPRDFDYVYLNYGPRRMRLSGIRGPQIYYPTIRDIAFSFHDFSIDTPEKLYGKQYLEMEIQVTDKNNKLVELKTINNITICPGERSPRYQYYNKNDCGQTNISLNDYLRTKTYEMPEWSRVKITTKHKENKYRDDIQINEIEIIQGKRYKFDVEVSFPAGLITIYKEYDKDDDGRYIRDEAGNRIRKDEYNYGNLGGISMAMIAQFSFYHPDKIAQYRPYKIGAGFIALNAFNFSENTNQDLGIVLLGSVYPTTRDVKLSFPLFIGGGYLIKEATPFFMLGPGIRVRL